MKTLVESGIVTGTTHSQKWAADKLVDPWLALKNDRQRSMVSAPLSDLQNFYRNRMSRYPELEKIVRLTAYPRQVSDLANAESIIGSHIIGSYAPTAPPISPDGRIVCIGSCFAAEMAKSLKAQGRNVEHLSLTERWNTAFAVRHFVELGIDGTPIPKGYIPRNLTAFPDAAERFHKADAYIITLGLSICWFELGTDQMILDIPAGHAVKNVAAALTTHTMRQTSVSQNAEQIEATIVCIKRSNPVAPIILTLSPNPFLLSLTDYPPVPSNTISKSTLRIAIHEVMERNIENVFYWPSYEIVEWTGKYIRLLWGQGEHDLRHLESKTVDDVMRRFSKLYFIPG